MTHDYTRHGTTSLLAALEVASGKVHRRCIPRHTHVEFIAFLKFLARRYWAAEVEALKGRRYGDQRVNNGRAKHS